jgi:hypothetical protein
VQLTVTGDPVAISPRLKDLPKEMRGSGEALPE